jgi:phosphate transport system substrate-binding protein
MAGASRVATLPVNVGMQRDRRCVHPLPQGENWEGLLLHVRIPRQIGIGLVAAAAVVLTAGPASAAPALPSGTVGALGGQGATFPALLYKAEQATFSIQHPSVFDPGGDSTKGLVMSYNPIGSGAGIKEFYSSDARKPIEMFGASDALLANSDKTAITAAVGGFQMLPSAVGAIAVVYNLPPLYQKLSATSKLTRPATLYLDGPTLGKIYAGQITRWNDPAIVHLNPLITKLPSSSISPVYRSDGSGTTFIFTSYLNKVSTTWHTALGGAPSKTLADKISTMPSKVHAIGAPGNEGVSASVANQRGAIGYVELAYANQLGLKYAWMRTGDTTHAYYTPPSVSGAQSAAAVAARAGTAANPVNPGTVESGAFYQPVNQKGATTYAISGYTWLLLYDEYKGSNDPGLGTTQALVAWVSWLLSPSGGQASYARLGYGALPLSVSQADESLLQTITYNGTQVWKGN